MESDQFLDRQIEALVFSSAEPVSVAELQVALDALFETEVPEEHIAQAMQRLVAKYASEEYVFSIQRLAGGYQFLTKPSYQAGIALLLKHKGRKKLSTSALETLSIVAYKQPITKAEIETIRGVSSDYALQKLLDRELVELRGKADGPGRPLLYGTGHKFLEFFGIDSLADLPQLKDFKNEDGEPGLAATLPPEPQPQA